MEEVIRWFVGFMIFIATLGIVVIFAGVSYLDLDASKLTLFAGFKSNLYDASRQFIISAGLLTIGLIFAGIAVSIKDFLWELAENF